jgi:hypothetical protein
MATWSVGWALGVIRSDDGLKRKLAIRKPPGERFRRNISLEGQDNSTLSLSNKIPIMKRKSGSGK